MKHILHIMIKGIPYSQSKVKGNTDAPKKWTQAVVEQTKSLPKVKDACIMRVTFRLPRNKYPSDLPYGPDLDNLMKRLFDALNETIFSETQGKDSCVEELSVIKKKAKSEEDAGALLEVFPITMK